MFAVSVFVPSYNTDPFWQARQLPGSILVLSLWTNHMAALSEVYADLHVRILMQSPSLHQGVCSLHVNDSKVHFSEISTDLGKHYPTCGVSEESCF